MFKLFKSDLDRFTEMLKRASIGFSIEVDNEEHDTNYCMEMDQASDGHFNPTVYTHVRVYHNDFVFDRFGELTEVLH